MRKTRGGRLDAVFGALSDPIRRAMLAQLGSGESSVSTLSRPFSVSAPAISKHLRVLESSGLINRRKVGRVHYCRLRKEPLVEAGDWIQQQRAFWHQQLESLAKYLEEEQEECHNPPLNEPGSPSGSKNTSMRHRKPSFERGPIRKL